MLWSFRAHWATSQDMKTCYKPNQTNVFPPELSELCSIKGGISHIKSLETDPERTNYLKPVVALQELDHIWNLWSLLSHFKNKIIYETYEACCQISRIRSPMKPPCQSIRMPSRPSHSISSRSISIFLNMKLSGFASPWQIVSSFSKLDVFSSFEIFLLFGRFFFDNLTLKIPNRFSAILAKKPQKVIIDYADFSHQ